MSNETHVDIVTAQLKEITTLRAQLAKYQAAGTNLNARKAEVAVLKEQLAAKDKEAEAMGKALGLAYERGWITAATWAIRDDLISDIGSSAYLKDRDEALLAIKEALS